MIAEVAARTIISDPVAMSTTLHTEVPRWSQTFRQRGHLGWCHLGAAERARRLPIYTEEIVRGETWR